MKTKRTLAIAVLAALALGSVGATDLSTIVESAKENSPSYQNSVITYQNGLLNIRKQEIDDQVGITVNATLKPLESYGNDKYGVSVAPDVTVTLPNDGKTTITGNMSYATDYENTKHAIGGGLGVSHTFDFTGYTDSKAQDLSYTSLKYSTEYTFRNAELSFEKTVISTLSSLLSAEKSMEKSRDTLQKQEKTLSNMEALGTYSTTSATYTKTKNTIQSLKESLEAAEQQLQDARYNYKVLTGLDWDCLDPLTAPELELTTYDNGNTSVIIRSLSAESAVESYLSTLASYNPNALSVGANASVSSRDYAASLTSTASTTWSLSGSAGYKTATWSVSAAPTLSITTKDSSTTTTPGLTIKGSWTNKSTESNDLELQKLLNSAQSAQNDYISAMSSYTQNAQNLAVRILNWNYKKAQAEANMAYLEMLLENKKSLYSLGLATESDVADAELEISQAKYDWEIMILDGLSLQCDLEIFSL